MVKEEAEEVITDELPPRLPPLSFIKGDSGRVRKAEDTVSYKIPDNRTINYYRHLATNHFILVKNASSPLRYARCIGARDL